MSDDLKFIIERLRHFADTSKKTIDLLLVTGRYIREAFKLGLFSGVRFVEFRTTICEDADPGKIVYWRVLAGLDWLSENAQSVGFNYPSLPTVGDQNSAAYPNLERMKPHIEALATLMAELPEGGNAGWPVLSPAELRKLFDIEQDTLVKRLESQKIPNEKITVKSYRIDPDSLPEGWKKELCRN